MKFVKLLKIAVIAVVVFLILFAIGLIILLRPHDKEGKRIAESIPRYPNTSCWIIEQKGGGNLNEAFVVIKFCDYDNKDSILDFYKNELPKNGWTQSNPNIDEETGIRYLAYLNKEKNYTIYLTVGGQKLDEGFEIRRIYK